MNVLKLSVENIGPFDQAELDFRDASEEAAPVTFITGENGTGKSVLIDSVRAMFGEECAVLSRPLRRVEGPFGIELEVRKRLTDNSGGVMLMTLNRHRGRNQTAADFISFIHGVRENTVPAPRWVLNYWQSALTHSSFHLESLRQLDHRAFLVGALDIQQRNDDTTNLLCNFDYIRDSRDPDERRLGELVWSALERIVEVAVEGGRLLPVARTRLEPMFEQHGLRIGIDKLSAGSLYLIQRMTGLLGRMFSCHIASGREDDDLLTIPGLLLIDEAENHLHPKWQKRFIPAVRRLFPNLQIIAATHSPFIIASIPNAKVFVCEAGPERCTVSDVTRHYANQPIDEILMSPVFSSTLPYNEEISRLLEQRWRAIREDDEDTRRALEAKLKGLNPAAFAYFDLEDRLAAIAEGREA